MARLPITLFFIIAVAICATFSEAKSVHRKHHHSHNSHRSSVTRHHKRLAEENQARTVCESEECEKIARVLQESMNDTVDPCTNFYDYACGNWEKNNPLPKGEQLWSMMVMLQKYVRNQTSGILKEENKPDDILPLKLARKLYKSCMDFDDMERRGLEPLVLTVARSGGWPMILDPDEYDENQLTWQKIDDYYIYLTGQLSFIDIRISPTDDERGIYMPFLVLPRAPVGSFLLSGDDDEAASGEPSDSEEQTTVIPDSQEKGSKEQPDDGQDEKSKLSEGDDAKQREKRDSGSKKAPTAADRRKKYHDFVTEVAVAVADARGFPVTAESISQDVDDLIDFSIEMQKLRNFRTTYTNMTIREFQDWYDGLGYTSKTSQIDWIHKFTTLFHNANAEIDENLLLVVSEVEYIEKLAALLDKTPPRTIVNYVHWRIGSHSLDATTWKMRFLVMGLKHFPDPTDDNGNDGGEGEGGKSGDEEEEAKEKIRKSRERYCEQEGELNSIFEFEYIKRHFDKSSIAAAKKMVEKIRVEIEAQMNQSDWMDESTKTYALTKLKGLDSIIGYPKWYDNKTLVNSFFKGLIVSPSYYENVINNAKRKNWKRLSLAMKSVLDYGNDDIEPTMVNAFYNPMTNSIAITAADLQSPLYHSTRPAMINYGMIGLIIGHEINHAFDSGNFGEKFPGMESPNILTDAYGSRAGCFVEQYNNYAIQFGPDNGTDTYGNQTSGENISDSMGLVAAYHAYKKQEIENGGSEPALPGMETFSNDQLFFLSYANVWCQVAIKKLEEMQFKYDSHSPAFMRVIGPLSNSEEFAAAYNCPTGSPMNPETKCNIWK